MKWRKILEEMRVVAVAKRDGKAGEELFPDYDVTSEDRYTARLKTLSRFDNYELGAHEASVCAAFRIAGI